MQVDDSTLVSSLFSTSTKIKEEESNADEFQALLNSLKNEEEESSSDKSTLVNEDLDLDSAIDNYTFNAIEKAKQDRYAQIEDDILKKLLEL
ncbi:MULTISPECIES: hypothetical protein [unclassified Campylobacter]|uniref:hypothetical protein n=1 Tax=unclassified Campylobacter TaxID=2593542 RepID=UPI0012383938|nr:MULTISPECIES: hypothetical protein [unclassified Campylobacter]KAA6228438.1 hypothetical protein FMM54_00850 [Campylobacter sp. LR185c]KAA6228925.1 hypothetical protein FMM55_00395 [Campylobacter sp. LR196d]KAA6229410.1 hypothetical protein FMM57_00855 [Campylobacter sp. LR286c]KAA6229876.1 hypothetical protein FMM56_07535 [Campylobacter sp. LR264d]KAA6234089.1 hypothetical protein FMM58_00950 [Campylobacter sp. LR291e]